jgi:hypothetical protein
MDGEYAKPAITTGVIVFLCAWVYAGMAYGFFLGVGLGWIPAAVFGFLAGALWPLLWLGVLAFVLLVAL